MPLIYRSHKGSPLSYAEVDGNFRNLDERLTHLEEDIMAPEKFDRVEVVGSQLTFYGTQGSTLGPVEMPVVKWNPRGMWSDTEGYHVDDVVQYQEGIYVCLKSHSPSPDFQSVHWKSLLCFPRHSKEAVPSFPKLPLVNERINLPKEASLGDLCLLVGEGAPQPLYHNGEVWMPLGKA